MRNRLRLGVTALSVAFVVAIALGASGILTPKNQRTALGASTTLAIISGDVQVRHGANGTFDAAADGMVLGPGDTVRTGVDARAVLTYFEGSTVEIEPSSELAIEVAHGNPDGSTIIEMRQDLGTTWHVVTHLVKGGSKYEVRTTASTASVRGTQFVVGVEADQSTSVTTTEGDVATSDPAATKVVEVTPGLTTTTKVNEKPEDPKTAPEPDRKVTVTVGDQNTLVVDAFGRANGIKDGKKIVQTPGAQVSIVDGKMVVTLPNVPDGDVATHFQDTNKSNAVDVTTKVEEKNKKTVEVTETVKPSETAVTGVELKRTSNSGSSGSTGATGATGTGGSSTDEAPTLKLKKITDTKGPKVGEILKTPTTDDQQQSAPRGGGTQPQDSETAKPRSTAEPTVARETQQPRQTEQATDTQAPPETQRVTTGGNNNNSGGFVPRIEVPTPPKPTERVVTEKPATEKPKTEKPATEKPATEKPVTEKPVTEKPATGKPQQQQTEPPATVRPRTDPPTTAPPTTARPTQPGRNGQGGNGGD